MQLYQFERIYSQMEKEFGKIPKGSEEKYTSFLYPMESNALKVHRANPDSNSRRLKEAIALVLFDIKSRITGETIDVESFRNEDNRKLEYALLSAFDPFTNEDIKDLADVNDLHEYYKIPVMCLLRIKWSVEYWEKHYGSNGYFTFIERQMGALIRGDQMEFAVPES